MTWEEVGLPLLGRVAWAWGIRLVIGWGQEGFVDVGRLGILINEPGRSRGLRCGSIGKTGGTGWGSVCLGLGGEREGLNEFVLDETADVATSVFGVQNILQFLLVATADPEEECERDEGDTTDTSHDATDDWAND